MKNVGNWEGGKYYGVTVAQCAALLPHSKKVVGSSPAWCNLSGLVPRPFCVEFACSPRVHPGSPHRTPQQQQKHAKRTDAHQSCPWPRQDRALGLGPRAPHCWLPTAPGCPWGRTPGWVKGRRYIPPTPPNCMCVCVCVCCVSPLSLVCN